jgi:hypothetical protein
MCAGLVSGWRLFRLRIHCSTRSFSATIQDSQATDCPALCDVEFCFSKVNGNGIEVHVSMIPSRLVVSFHSCIAHVFAGFFLQSCRAVWLASSQQNVSALLGDVLEASCVFFVSVSGRKGLHAMLSHLVATNNKWCDKVKTLQTCTAIIVAESSQVLDDALFGEILRRFEFCTGKRICSSVLTTTAGLCLQVCSYTHRFSSEDELELSLSWIIGVLFVLARKLNRV